MHAPAQGTEGTVYFGWRDSDLFPVAIKVPHGGNEEALRLEAEALSSLCHPNIVPLLAAPTIADGRTVIVMPMLMPLAYFLPMTTTGARGVLLDVLAALEYIHGKGRIQGDLRVGNVALNDERRAILLDFSNHLSRSPRTPDQIMAPELIRGASHSPQSDIYAAGLLAMELIGAPFIAPGESLPQMVDAHLYRSIPPVFGASEWNAAIAKACAKDPDARYGNALEMRRVIEALA